MTISIPKPKKTSLPKPPGILDPKITNLTKKPSSQLVTLNLKVPVEFRREVKLYATRKDTTIVNVLKQAFLAYKEKNI